MEVSEEQMFVNRVEEAIYNVVINKHNEDDLAVLRATASAFIELFAHEKGLLLDGEPSHPMCSIQREQTMIDLIDYVINPY